MSQPGAPPGGFGVLLVDNEGLRRDLRAVDKKLPNVIRKVHREIAKEGRTRARSKALGLPGRKRFARLIASRGSARAATISYHGNRHPAAMGWLFGAYAYPQFKPWVGNRHTGVRQDLGDSHAITPAIKELEPQWAKTYAKRIGQMIAQTLEN